MGSYNNYITIIHLLYLPHLYTCTYNVQNNLYFYKIFQKYIKGKQEIHHVNRGNDTYIERIPLNKL